MTNAEIDRSVHLFAQDYMEKIFYFCLRKTGNRDEAEDLTQDIAVCIITALNRGTMPENFSAWIWQIVRNRYAAWAVARHKGRETVADRDPSDCEIADPDPTVLESMVHAEQLSLLRRELAFVRRDYRDILVAYYIDERRIRDIADSLSLSETAVKQRLHRARNILREGMDMAREFGVRSYKPEQISFVMNGREGKNGQPWSVLSHLLYKNIFLEAYENPETAEELSLALGIALPYMEDELAYLVKEQFLRREGERYRTNFRIVSREEQRKQFEESKRVQAKLTAKLCEMIDLYVQNGDRVHFDGMRYEDAKWALLVRAFDILSANVRGKTEDKPYPKRPDGGMWEITGYESIDWQEPFFVGQHGGRWFTIGTENPDRLISFWQFKFFYKGLCDRTPDLLEREEAYTLWKIGCGAAEKFDPQVIQKLVGYGYLKEKDGKPVPQYVIFEPARSEHYGDDVKERLAALDREISALIGAAPHINRGYVVEQALENGWLRYDEHTPPVVGAYVNK